jgi:acetyl esterase
MSPILNHPKIPLYLDYLPLSHIKYPTLGKLCLKFFKHPLSAPYHSSDVPQARLKETKMASSIFSKYIFGSEPKIEYLQEVFIPVKDSHIRTFILSPKTKNSLPVCLFLHGGGYVLGNFQVYETLCRTLCKALGLVIVFPEYRLAPEHKYPTALEDAWVALEWVKKHIVKYQGNPSQFFVMGDSAGGALATILARDSFHKFSTKISGQILLYPWVSHEQSPDLYASFGKFGEGYVLTKALLEFFTECYLKESDNLKNANISPIYSSNLGNSPPALFFLASHDPLRDSGLKYYKKLISAHIPAQFKVYQPAIHGILQYSPILPKGKKIFQDFLKTTSSFIESHLSQINKKEKETM